MANHRYSYISKSQKPMPDSAANRYFMAHESIEDINQKEIEEFCSY